MPAIYMQNPPRPLVVSAPVTLASWTDLVRETRTQAAKVAPPATVESNPLRAFFATSFLTNQTPLSENGAWRTGATHGLDWTDPAVILGLAQGTQNNSGALDDSIACLTQQFPANCSASVRIRQGGAAARFQEVEILLRFTIGAHIAHGYECNYAYNGEYCDLVRWEDGVFTHLHTQNGVAAPVDGDIMRCEIIGNTFNCFLNNVLQNTVDITAAGGAVFTTGSPGLGFYRSGGGASNQYTIDRFTAVGL